MNLHGLLEFELFFLFLIELFRKHYFLLGGQVQDIEMVFLVVAETALVDIISLNQDLLRRVLNGCLFRVDLLFKREFSSIEHFLIDFQNTLFQHFIFLLLEIFQIVVPGLG